MIGLFVLGACSVESDVEPGDGGMSVTPEFDAGGADGLPGDGSRDGQVAPPDHDPDEGTGDGAANADGGASLDAGPGPVEVPCAVDPERVWRDVEYLASRELRGRIPGDIGNEQALDFAESEFRAAGLEGGGPDGSYRQPFDFSCSHDWCRNNQYGVTENVIAKLPGKDPALASEVIIIGAHIDHLGVRDDGAVYGGADDNASGAAIVLELARMFQRCNLAPSRTLLFVEWNAEEMGLIGSRHFVDSPTVSLDSIKAVYNFDMVGGGDGSGILLFGGDDQQNRWLTDLMVNAAEAEGLEHVIELVPQKLASDHAPFVQRGIPICWGFARPDPHPGYHQPEDDMSRIKLESLRAVSELFWAALRPLSLGDEQAFAFRAHSPRLRSSDLALSRAAQELGCGK
nr:Peptidase M28 [uncultured bacterium]